MKELKINGTAYPFRLELGGMRLYAIKKGLKKVKTKDLPDLIQDADMIEDYPILIWAGLKAGPKPEEDRFEHDVEEVKQWLEEDPAAFDRAMDMINEDSEAEPPESLEAGNGQEAKANQ